MMRLVNLFLMFALSGLLLGCSSTKTRTSYDTETDFSALKTYAWMPDVDDAFPTTERAEHFVNAVDAQLESKGFKLVTDSPDVVIRVHRLVTYREEGASVYGGTVQFAKSMIRMDFLHPDTGKPMWEGVMDAYLEKDANIEEVKKQIDVGVETLFMSFPPD